MKLCRPGRDSRVAVAVGPTCAVVTAAAAPLRQLWREVPLAAHCGAPLCARHACSTLLPSIIAPHA